MESGGRGAQLLDPPRGLPVLQASASTGQVRKDHGLAVSLRGRLTNTREGGGSAGEIARVFQSQNATKHLTLDFLGPWDKALNPLFATAARWFFPFKLGNKTTETFRVSDAPGGDAQHLYGEIGLGLKKLSSRTIFQALQDQIDGGDPVLVLQVTLVYRLTPKHAETSRVLFYIPTKCSFIKSALESGGGTVIFTGECPDYTPSRVCAALGRAKSLLRWVLYPAAFSLLAVALTFLPSYHGTIAAYVPDIFSGNFGHARDGNNGTDSALLVDLLPPMPRTKAEAFQLGQLEERLAAAEAVGAGDVAELLLSAAQLIGRAKVTAEELHGTLAQLIEVADEQATTVGSRIWGFLSFVNLIWIFSILGLAISIGPCIYHLLSPLRQLLVRFIKWITEKVLVPLAKRCHQYGIFELLAWIGCAVVLVNELYHRDAVVQEFFALTALALAVPSSGYSTLLRGPTFLAKRTIVQFGQVWMFLTAGVMAVQFQSTLFGYISVGCLYSFLGFHTACGGLCYFVGFDSEDALVRCAVASLVLLTGFVGAKAAAVSAAWLVPFSSAVSVLGSNMLFLALLIVSHRYAYSRNKKALSYPARNALMLVCLLSAWLFGLVLGIPGLSTTAIVYAVLWGMEKYVEFHREMKWNNWLLMVVVCGTLWRASLFLHTHPEILVQLFNGFKEQLPEQAAQQQQ